MGGIIKQAKSQGSKLSDDGASSSEDTTSSKEASYQMVVICSGNEKAQAMLSGKNRAMVFQSKTCST
eukprot:6652052-Ditylum_brightwellii.AAC.1